MENIQENENDLAAIGKFGNHLISWIKLVPQSNSP